MSEPIHRDEFDRVLEGVFRAETRLTARIDDGFEKVNGRLRTVESRSDVMESRMNMVERVIYAGVGLALTAVALAILDAVIKRGN